MEKKYEITNDEYFKSPFLHRIKALKSFGDVKKGDLGGYIEDEGNLSQEGNSWVYDDACVMWGAKVSGNAAVREDAIVANNSIISDNAVVSQKAQIHNSKIYGNAAVYGDAMVHKSEISGNSNIHGMAYIENRYVSGSTEINNAEKYKLIPETIEYKGRTLYRIRALRSFGDVKKGDLGGFVENNSRMCYGATQGLDHSGNAWVYGNAKIMDGAYVTGDAKIYGDAAVYDRAKISGSARVFENAQVFGSAQVLYNAQVFGNAKVLGDAYVEGMSKVYGNAIVEGQEHLCECEERNGSYHTYEYYYYGSDCRKGKNLKLEDGLIVSCKNNDTMYLNNIANKAVEAYKVCTTGEVPPYAQSLKVPDSGLFVILDKRYTFNIASIERPELMPTADFKCHIRDAITYLNDKNLIKDYNPLDKIRPSVGDLYINNEKIQEDSVQENPTEKNPDISYAAEEDKEKVAMYDEYSAKKRDEELKKTCTAYVNNEKIEHGSVVTCNNGDIMYLEYVDNALKTDEAYKIYPTNEVPKYAQSLKMADEKFSGYSVVLDKKYTLNKSSIKNVIGKTSTGFSNHVFSAVEYLNDKHLIKDCSTPFQKIRHAVGIYNDLSL